MLTEGFEQTIKAQERVLCERNCERLSSEDAGVVKMGVNIEDILQKGKG